MSGAHMGEVPFREYPSFLPSNQISSCHDVT
jgi:hypothetical protein